MHLLVLQHMLKGIAGAHRRRVAQSAADLVDELEYLAAALRREKFMKAVKPVTSLIPAARNSNNWCGLRAHELCAPIARIQFALGILEHTARSQTPSTICRKRCARCSASLPSFCFFQSRNAAGGASVREGGRRPRCERGRGFCSAGRRTRRTGRFRRRGNHAAVLHDFVVIIAERFQ